MVQLMDYPSNDRQYEVSHRIRQFYPSDSEANLLLDRFWKLQQGGHTASVPVSLEEIAEQQDFIDRWDALEQEGTARDWLEPSYEGGDYPASLRRQRQEFVKEESDEHFQARYDTMFAQLVEYASKISS
jgi:hypothetical protein